MAYFQKRDYVIPDDVLEVFYPIIAHRIILSSEAKINQVSIEDVLLKLRKVANIPIL